MDNTFYKKTLKTKKIELIDALNTLGNNITSKIKEKNSLIKELNEKVKNVSIDEKYRIKKNKELDSLKSELNGILKDIDNIITNITA